MSLLQKLYEAQESKDHVTYEKIESELQCIRLQIAWLTKHLESQV